VHGGVGALPEHQEPVGVDHVEAIGLQEREDTDEADGVVPAAEFVDGERVVGQETLPGDGEPLPGVVGPQAADEQGQGALVRPHDATLAAPEHERELFAEQLLGAVLHRLDGDHGASREERCSP
jgi:hypothetical protein